MKFAKTARSHSVVRHGGPYSIRRYGAKMLDFSSNVNPLGFPSIVKKSLDLAKIKVYPDHDSAKLKHSISKYLGMPTSMICVGNGATEVIYDFCKMMPKSKALIVSPTFGEYEAASRLYGLRPEFFVTLCLQDDLQKFIQKIPKNGLIFVCNPNNPTGELLSKKSMTQIIMAAKAKSSMVFVDECFIELTQSQNESTISLIPKYQHLFVLRSLTKSFGLAGLRLGYGIGNKNLISILTKTKIPWSVNGLAHQAGIAALSDKQFLTKTQKLVKKESTFLVNSISEIDGFSCFDSTTNFILIRTKQASKLVQKKLLKQNILVRDCSNFRGLGHNHIRVAVRTRKENQKLVSALEKI